MKKFSIIFTCVILIIAIVTFLISREVFYRTTCSVFYPEEITINLDTFTSIGDENAPVTIIELSDFECPYSKKVQLTLDTLHMHLEGVIKHYYKPRPVYTEKYRRQRSRAVLAAKKQDRYWEMKEKLYQIEIDSKDKKSKNAMAKAIMAAAEDCGLDMEKFTRDFKSRKVKNELLFCDKEADKFGLKTVPTLIINGTIAVGIKSFEQYLDIIESKL